MNKHYLTQEGLEKLKKELDYLKNVKRKEVIQRIQAAKELGDLSENAEYADAKEEQSFIEGRIIEIENILNKSVIISEENRGDMITVGSSVVIDCSGKEQRFTIVGSNEADPSKGYISNESPMGKALLGKKVGDVFEVNTPRGPLKCKILKIRP